MPTAKRFRMTVSLLAALAGCGALLCPIAGHSQDSQAQQTQSVADAARKAREEKKAAAAKPTKVFTDDDLPKTSKSGADPVTVTSQQTAAQASEAQQGSAAGDASAQAATPPADAATPATKATGEDSEVTQLKEQIADVKKELDLRQRGLALDQDSFYSKVDYAHDDAGRAKLATEQQQVNDKQLELDGLKAQLAALGVSDDTDKKPANQRVVPVTAPTPPKPKPQPQEQPAPPQQQP